MPELPPPPAPGPSPLGASLPAPPPAPFAAAPQGLPDRGPRALRTAWPAFVLVLVNAPIAGWFAIWGLNGVNHCDDPNLRPDQSCGLGFAALIPLAWVLTALLAAGACAVGLARLPRWAAWGVCLLAIALMWALNLGAMSAYQPRR